ncbi:hypothetical protein [Noviherbaspirillum sedimenti]|nr:hypothetical protein [Noviherbaspirillum sedimenti]
MLIVFGLLMTAGALALNEAHPAHNKRIAAVTASPTPSWCFVG